METDGGGSAFVPVAPRGTSAACGGVGRWEPPGGAPRFPRALRTPLGLEHPKRCARPSPGLLTDSADTQATKPKVSKIQARHIFPRGPAAPSRRLKKCSFLPSARRSPRRETWSRAAAATSARAQGLPLRPRRHSLPPPVIAPESSAAPRERSAFSLVGFCTLDAELLLRGGCSLDLFLLCCCFTPPRTPSPCRGSASDFEEYF